MNRKLLEVINEKEARELVKYTILLEQSGLWENSLDLMHALSKEGAFLINGSPRIDDPEGRRSRQDAEVMGQIITTCMAVECDELEAVCKNVIAWVKRGVKPTRWTEAETPGNARQRLKEGLPAKTYEQVAKEDKEQREKRRKRAIKPLDVNASNYEREMMARLRREPAVRAAMARELGAKVAGEPPKASGIVCPSCGKKSIWFYIDVDRMTTARCNHQNSCGYWGSLYDLARAIN